MLKKALIPLLFLISFSTLANEVLEGRVVNVHDGDTVTLVMTDNQTIRVRLAQIDAPELAQESGPLSQQSLAQLVLNQDIKVQKETVDKYGRVVGTLFVGGLNANREQVIRGMAWVYRQYMHDKTLLSAEDNARTAHLGLWANPNPIAPWDYRHSSQ